MEKRRRLRRALNRALYVFSAALVIIGTAITAHVTGWWIIAYFPVIAGRG